MVDDAGFGYLAVRESDTSDRPSSIIAHLVALKGPLQAVIWDVRKSAWTFDPTTAAAFVFDDAFFDKRFHVERDEAERIARQILHSELPTEDELRRLCAAGLAAWMEEEDLSAEFEDDDWDLDDDATTRPAS